MIDRESRKSILAAMDDYLDGTIKTSEFVDRLDALKTDDQTVREIRFFTWGHHDDLIDHQVKLSRQEWNFFQRLRLILQSDAEITGERFWNWTAFHALLFSLLGSLILIACIWGIG